MQVYLVGGAVRDELLGRPVTERDWVVVGGSPQEMQTRGFRMVGREFPVFLHPHSHEEYALARLERKTGPGYRGFTTHFSPEVTLEQDLQRRDLTINAMARSADGTLVDPYGGQQDLRRKLLRHVSPAFVEDPVRVLRLARFAARFAGLGFTVAAETLELMRRMVADGEINALVPERLWREMQRALGEPHPEAFFDTLQACAALAVLLPELAWDEPQRQGLLRAAQLSADALIRFAALLCGSGRPAIIGLCERLRVAAEYRELALLSDRLLARLPSAAAADAAAKLELFELADAFRRPDRFEKLLLTLQARVPAGSVDWHGLRRAFAAAAAVSLPPGERSQLAGPAHAAALRSRRLECLQTLQ
jgi:tRNA nucleotidyltransferase (CCA-adding enzyme)